MNNQHVTQTISHGLLNETEHHFAALFHRLAQKIQLACADIYHCAAYPAPHVATLPAETPAADLVDDVEKSGGEEIIKLQRVDTLRRTLVTRWMPVDIGSTFQRLDIFHGVKKQRICRQGSCYILPQLRARYDNQTGSVQQRITQNSSNKFQILPIF